jgi:hypothetical protein
MAGWVKWEKDLETDPRFIRLARKLRDTCHAGALQGALPAAAIASLTAGCLLRFWAYADTHIRADDTLDLGLADIDDLVGFPGFAQAMPEDWMRPIDDGNVELPGYQTHNGVEAKKRDLNQKRQERRRSRIGHVDVTQERDASVTQALPDQTRPDQTSTDTLPGGQLAATPERERKRTSRTWPRELHDGVIAAYHELLPDLPAVRDWPERRKRKLDARIGERMKAGKRADELKYWRDLFAKVQTSDFLCGRKGDWRCPGLEWLLEPANFLKVIEGNYDNTARPNGAGHAR